MDDPRITEAADSYPLVSLPPGFIKKTMRRLPPRPAISFLDVALPLFLVTFLGAGLLSICLTLKLLDPLQVASLRLSWRAWQLSLPPQGLFSLCLTAALGLGGLGFFLMVWLVFGRGVSAGKR